MKNIQLEHGQHQTTLKKYPVCFLAHDIDVPMNIGSLFRIADAFGVEKIYLSGSSPVPPNSKIKKTSRSTEKYVPFSHEKNPFDLINRLKSEGYTIISLEITSSSTDIRELSISSGEKVCLILGSENTGVCQELLDASDKTAHIPMLGQNSSLNVATACSIATFEIIRRFLPYGSINFRIKRAKTFLQSAIINNLVGFKPELSQNVKQFLSKVRGKI